MTDLRSFVVAITVVLVGCGAPPPAPIQEKSEVDLVGQTLPSGKNQRQDNQHQVEKKEWVAVENPVVLEDQETISGPAQPPVMQNIPRKRPLEVLASTAKQAQRSHDVAALVNRVAAPFYQDEGRERYEHFISNGAKFVAKDPVSTFSVDVDTAAYANVRRMLNHGQWPQMDAVRIEEMVNYFNYGYPKKADESAPFSVFSEIGPSPWNQQRQLLHIGVNGWQPDQDDGLPPANLVFLIDVSGSMRAPNKLELLKSAMKMLVKQLRPQDTLSIAVYAGASGRVLTPTSGDQQHKMLAALDGLTAGGSTNGASGITLAYQMARENFVQGGINRVILATDGDFNVGTTDVVALEKMVEQQRKSGVALSVLGFGTGNYNDQLMQKIAQIGDGNAAYIDNLSEARKVLVDELGATLHTIAKDVKIQIEFNPAVVESYRLIGYETRHLNREDFNNDKIDAGEIGAGHTVTALYELTLVNGEDNLVDPLRYADHSRETQPTVAAAELGFVKIRYKRPSEQSSRLIQNSLLTKDIQQALSQTSPTYRFSAAVAWFGQLLRNQNTLDHDSFDSLIQLAQQSRGMDSSGYKGEFVNLVRSARALSLALGYDVKTHADVAHVK